MSTRQIKFILKGHYKFTKEAWLSYDNAHVDIAGISDFGEGERLIKTLSLVQRFGSLSL